MGKAIDSGSVAIVMDDRDHVATALRDLVAGSAISYKLGGETVELLLLEAISFGHKVAVVAITEGTHVRKYGEVIGRATVSIPAGRHVHVHNIEGIRGRGDQANSGMSSTKGAAQS
ncbi:SAF domain protein [Paenibacillus curdlanolyticus YK9]|uniref:SAF domain protein n=1 Tax=Paenibacillus curdlanolyticus YK9 TaxID=717606 RepID=E0IDN3_9BACL|nr:UxaA family hydrolase [Paenibacillus curdlanolyticus]EFM09237.1 SAF domain protein [Paenibacillus curdlanolyticus YK9]